MNSNFEIAKSTLFAPTGLSEQDLQKILQKTLGPGIDFADIFLQASETESWALEEGLIKKGSFTKDQGVGIRAISGDKTGYAYADDLLLPALSEAAEYARKIAQSGKTATTQAFVQVKAAPLYLPLNPLTSLNEEQKVELLKKTDSFARSLDSRVNQVTVNIAGSYSVIFIIASDGTLAADIRPLVRFDVSVLVEENGRREIGSSGGGGRSGYEIFSQNDAAFGYAREAVRIALNNLQAIAAPAGTMPVVLKSGWPAVMLHEAIGHGLEADFNRKGFSVYTNKIGQQVASKLCSVVDQGNLPGQRRGSITIDDEGTPTQETLLIENGILRSYMQDKLNAHLMNTKSTGNGRRSSYANMPLPRMTNTYLLPGNHVPEEIIAAVDKGIYAVNFSGGQVDITSGEFVFSTSEAYLIENGKITSPVKNATLIGNGPAVLNKVSMLGNDLQFDNGVGTCGKNGQSVPVGVGQPTLLINELTVGGTEEAFKP